MQMSLNQLNKTNFYMKSTRTRFETEAKGNLDMGYQKLVHWPEIQKRKRPSMDRKSE